MKNILHLDHICGDIAQLVERMHGMHEVTGSTPVISTNLRQGYGWQASQLMMAKYDFDRTNRRLPSVVSGVNRREGWASADH